MADREKVIDGLCEAIGILHGYVPKRYWGYGEKACRDAIALLKEQEAVEPITEHKLFLCPVCKNTLFREQKFCHECGKRIGRSVKWDA